jgi:hypothetical protein
MCEGRGYEEGLHSSHSPLHPDLQKHRNSFGYRSTFRQAQLMVQKCSRYRMSAFCSLRAIATEVGGVKYSR